MGMTFTNKAIFALFDFKYPLFLLLFQNVFTILLLKICKKLGYIDFRPLEWVAVQNWIPVNIFFILMLTSGNYVLQLLSVPMVTIFKNFTTTIVALGDVLWFGQQASGWVWLSLVLMVGSALVAALNDLAFHFTGYMWMILNCGVSAAYVLYVRFAMKKTQLNEWGMVYYNNAIAIPFVLPILILSGELSVLHEELPKFLTLGFMATLLWSGVVGFLLGLCSLWTVKTTSPTTYSTVGALNKIPLTVIGYYVFASPISMLVRISIAIGLFAGALYAWAKQKALQPKASDFRSKV